VSATMNLLEATDDTRELLHWGIQLVEGLFESEREEDPLFPWAQMAYENGELDCGVRVERPHNPPGRYRKAGVMLSRFEPAQAVQGSLFEWQKVQESRQLMQVVDEINREWGSETLRFAVTGVKRSWQMQAGMRSPRFTTQWGEIPVVKVG